MNGIDRVSDGSNRIHLNSVVSSVVNSVQAVYSTVLPSSLMVFLYYVSDTFCTFQNGMETQTWNLSKNLHRRILRLKILHRQFHLISTVLVGKNTKNEWKWRNLLRWQKFYTLAGTDGMDKFHLCSWWHQRNNGRVPKNVKFMTFAIMGLTLWHFFPVVNIMSFDGFPFV